MNKKDPITSGILVSIVTLFLLTPLYNLIFKKDNINPKSPNTEIPNKNGSRESSIADEKGNSTNIKRRSPLVKNETGLVKNEDLSSFINTSITNTSDKTNIAITIIDESGNVNTSISSSIAGIYNQTGNIGVVGLLKSSFIHDHGFQGMIEGDSELIDKLNLEKYADYIAIGKVQYSIRDGKLVNGTFVCTASIIITIFSTSQNSVIKSFEISENGNGVSKAQSQKSAIDKLLNKYYSEYSSL
jgi:hypothetical protein